MAPEAIPVKLSKVTVPGASLAATLYAVTSGGAPCDGLLVGNTTTTTTQHLRDDDATATVSESRAAISSTLCCATSCSFYDAAGEIEESRLQELLRDQAGPLLGWLSYRPATAAASASASGGGGGGGPAPPLRPTMRECAVTQALLRRQLLLSSSSGSSSGQGVVQQGQGGPPMQAVLLLLLTSGVDHNGATLTWQYRCFQARQSASSGELLLEPLELAATNLGGHTGLAAYQELHGAATPTHPSALPTGVTSSAASSSASAHPASSGLAGSAAAAAASASPPLGALAAGARAQAAAVRQHCEGLLGSLRELCVQAQGGEGEVVELRRRRDALLAQLLQRGA